MKQLKFLPKTVNIIGLPINLGQAKKGTELGPDAIRASGLREKLERKGLSVRESGNVQAPADVVDQVANGASGKNAAHVSRYCHALAQSVAASVKQFDKTLVLGGDHSLGIGSVYGHAIAHAEQTPNKIAVLWIDAHAGECILFHEIKTTLNTSHYHHPLSSDINTESTSKSGNMHGMPVSFFLKGLPVSGSPSSTSFSWMSPIVESRNFAFIGLRDVEEVEQDLIKQITPGLKVFTSSDVKKKGARDVILQALDHIDPSGDLPIHVSFDIDVIDPRIVKSTGTTCPDGLVPDDAYIFGEEISRTTRLRVMDMVEVNPLIGTQADAKTTAFVSSEIIASFMQSINN
jgi:arginase